MKGGDERDFQLIITRRERERLGLLWDSNGSKLLYEGSALIYTISIILLFQLIAASELHSVNSYQFY